MGEGSLINFGSYYGVALDHLQLNTQVADGFVRVSDLRYPIKITNRPQLERDNILSRSHKEDDKWQIAVNEPRLISQAKEGKNNYPNFQASFVSTVVREMGKCLTGEKLHNGGDIRFGMLYAYISCILVDLGMVPISIWGGVASEADLTSIVSMAFTTIVLNHLMTNFGIVFEAGVNEVERKILRRSSDHLSFFNNPFVRHSIPELLLPPVPIDRLVRGHLYLRKHGDKMFMPTP